MIAKIAIPGILILLFIGVVVLWAQRTNPKKQETSANKVYLVYRNGLYYIYRFQDELFLYQDETFGPYIAHKVQSDPIKEKLKKVTDGMGLVVMKKPQGFKAKFQ